MIFINFSCQFYQFFFTTKCPNTPNWYPTIIKQKMNAFHIFCTTIEEIVEIVLDSSKWF